MSLLRFLRIEWSFAKWLSNGGKDEVIQCWDYLKARKHLNSKALFEFTTLGFMKKKIQISKFFGWTWGREFEGLAMRKR